MKGTKTHGRNIDKVSAHQSKAPLLYWCEIDWRMVLAAGGCCIDVVSSIAKNVICLSLPHPIPPTPECYLYVEPHLRVRKRSHRRSFNSTWRLNIIVIWTWTSSVALVFWDWNCYVSSLSDRGGCWMWRCFILFVDQIILRSCF